MSILQQPHGENEHSVDLINDSGSYKSNLFSRTKHRVAGQWLEKHIKYTSLF